MKRIEAYHILHDMWKDADEKQREAIDIAQNDIEFVDLMPDEIIAQFNYDTKTNADYIRSMSDTELATMLRRGFCGYIQTTSDSYCKESITCTDCFERWLKQPYKEKEE